MKDKIWELEHCGRRIRVINRISVFPPRTSEVLEVDGAVVKENNGGFTQLFAVLESDVEFAGATKHVEVLIAQKTGTVQTGCHILIDGQLVGGDTHAQLNLPDLKAAKLQYDNGPARYILKNGLLFQGLPFAVIMAAINPPESLPVGIISFILHFVLFGSAMGWFMWRNLKSRVEKKTS